MTPPELPSDDTHPLTLLPWYVTGTLGAAERAQVEAHLGHCADCQAELASLRDVREQVREAFTEPDAAPASAHQRVMERVRRSSGARPKVIAPSGFDRLAEFFQQLLSPKWAPAGAVALIALQVGVLMWAVQEPATPPQITERAVGMPTARVQVFFAPEARESEIRLLLGELRGQIVKGPAPDGSYVIEVLASDDARVQAKLEMLRARTELVTKAERAP